MRLLVFHMKAAGIDGLVYDLYGLTEDEKAVARAGGAQKTEAEAGGEPEVSGRKSVRRRQRRLCGSASRSCRRACRGGIKGIGDLRLPIGFSRHWQVKDDG